MTRYILTQYAKAKAEMASSKARQKYAAPRPRASKAKTAVKEEAKEKADV
jgi:hypothetical protein